MVDKQKIANKRTLKKSVVVVIAMFAFGFALIPIYNQLCKALNIGGYTNAVSEKTVSKLKVDTSRKIKVRLVSSVSAGLFWDFYPLVHEVSVHPGALKKVEYVIKNKSSSNTIGHAKFSLSPIEGGRHFNKVKCFCLGHGRSSLKAYEEKRLTLVFFVSPRISKRVNEITLTYTFMDASAYAAK